MKQIVVADWPKGLCRDLATISEESVSELGLTFEMYPEDGIGPQIGAIIATSSGTFAITRGLFQPNFGMCIKALHNRESMEEQLSAFLRETGLKDTDIRWKAMDPPPIPLVEDW